MKRISLILALTLACVLGFAQVKDAKALSALAKTRDAAKAKYSKNPKNAALKKSYLQVNDKYAYSTMMADFLSPHDKYAGALKIYRQSLKVDPQDKDARHWVQQIEAIYKSMNRPIPQ